MTIICWDGKTMAADKRNSSVGYCTTVTTLRCIQNGIATATGDGPMAWSLLEWATLGRLSDNFPE